MFGIFEEFGPQHPYYYESGAHAAAENRYGHAYRDEMYFGDVLGSK